MLLNGIPVILLHSWLMICGSLKGHVMCAELPLFCSNIMSTSLLPRLWQLWPCKVDIRPYFVHNIEVSQAACCTVYVKFEDKQESCSLPVLFYRLTVLRFFFLLVPVVDANLMFTGVFDNAKAPRVVEVLLYIIARFMSKVSVFKWRLFYGPNFVYRATAGLFLVFYILQPAMRVMNQNGC